MYICRSLVPLSVDTVHTQGMHFSYLNALCVCDANSLPELSCPEHLLDRWAKFHGWPPFFPRMSTKM